jgi:hypothetical protein
LFSNVLPTLSGEYWRFPYNKSKPIDKIYSLGSVDRVQLIFFLKCLHPNVDSTLEDPYEISILNRVPESSFVNNQGKTFLSFGLMKFQLNIPKLVV